MILNRFCLKIPLFLVTIIIHLSLLQAQRAEVVLVISRSRSVTPAEGAYDRSEYPSYNYLNRPPKILESPLDSKSLLSGTAIKILIPEKLS